MTKNLQAVKVRESFVCVFAPYKKHTLFSAKTAINRSEKHFQKSPKNQQNDCALSKDSDQPWHLPSLISVFAISLGIHPVWSECLLCAQWIAKDPSFLHADSEDWSDWADAQADLSLCCPHMPFCWFCQAAHISSPFSCSQHPPVHLLFPSLTSWSYLSAASWYPVSGGASAAVPR